MTNTWQEHLFATTLPWIVKFYIMPNHAPQKVQFASLLFEFLQLQMHMSHTVTYVLVPFLLIAQAWPLVQLQGAVQ